MVEPTCSAPTDLADMSLATTANASQTEIKVVKVTHNWTVKNFSHCYQEYLENFVRLDQDEDCLTWSVKIYPKGNGENNKDFVFLCLNRVLPPANAASGGKLGKIGFKSRFTLTTAENKEIEMRIHPNPSHSDYVSYIKRDVLFPQILPRDIIIVTADIDVAVETVTTSSDERLAVPDSQQQLIGDMRKMLRDGLHADFVIRVGGKEVAVNKAVLAARSAVFCAMLMHGDTDETKNGCMDISDLDYDVVWEMLEFIYTTQCPRGLSELGGELLVAADKYGLQDLKQHCERALIDELSTENACELLVRADQHSAARLRDKAVEFILNKPREITATNGWKMMLQLHQNLVTEIVQNFNRPKDGAHAATPS